MVAGEFKIVRGGRLLDPAAHDAAPADILIEADRIREVGLPGLAAPEVAIPIEATDRVLLPGLVNGHIHTHGALAKGVPADDWPLEFLLNAIPAINAERTVNDKRLCALVTAVEMVRKGSTTCFDMFAEFPMPTVEGLEAVGRAYEDVGMRVVLAPMMADLTLYEAFPDLVDSIPPAIRRDVEKIRSVPFQASIGICRDLLTDWPFDRSRVRPALAPTTPLHCSDDFLTRCRDLAREFDIPLQTHLAETKNQALRGMEPPSTAS